MKVKTKMTSVSVLVLLVWIATASSACLAQETRVEDKFSTECKTLGGTGSLNSECVVSKSHQWKASDVVTVIGPGNITVEENVTLSLDGSDGAFEQEGQLNISIGGRLTLMPGASLRAPTIVLAAKWLNLYTRSSVNASGLGSSTLGRPVLEEYGAGYGGTGSACDKTVGQGGELRLEVRLFRCRGSLFAAGGWKLLCRERRWAHPHQREWKSDACGCNRVEWSRLVQESWWWWVGGGV